MKARALVALGMGIASLSMSAAVMAQGTGDPAANWGRVAQCARQASASARHACVDQVLRETGMLDQAHELEQARESFGQKPHADKPHASRSPVEVDRQPGKASSHAPMASAAEAREASAPPPRLDVLNTQVASARLGPDRKLLVTTREGALWHQTESADIRFLPRKGDAFTIEKSALGGHRCKIGRGKIFRCDRIN